MLQWDSDADSVASTIESHSDVHLHPHSTVTPTFFHVQDLSIVIHSHAFGEERILISRGGNGRLADDGESFHGFSIKYYSDLLIIYLCKLQGFWIAFSLTL